MLVVMVRNRSRIGINKWYQSFALRNFDLEETNKKNHLLTRKRWLLWLLKTLSAVPPPHPLIYNRPNKLDLSYSGLEEFQQPEFEVYGLRVNKSVCETSSNETKKNSNAHLIEEWVFDNEDEVESPIVVEKKTVVPTIPKVDVVRPKQHEKPVRKPVKYAEMYSFDHLKKECGKRIIKPVWKNTRRVNDHYSTRMTHFNPRRNMIPQAVLMRSGIKAVNTAKPKDAHNAVKRKDLILLKLQHGRNNAQIDKDHFGSDECTDSGEAGVQQRQKIMMKGRGFPEQKVKNRSRIRINTSGSKLNEHTFIVKTPISTIQNQIVAAQPLYDLFDPIMQFIVHNFDQINSMYLAFSSKRKEIAQQQLLNSHVDSLFIPSGQSTFKKVASGANNMITEKNVSPNRPLKKNRVVNVVEDKKGLKMAVPIIDGSMKQKDTSKNIFYDTPFVFKEAEKNVRYLVTSLFTKQIRDYDMSDGLKVPTNLKTYDGLSNPDDHLTIFMGTMDVHKLPEPAWCRFFQITLSGAARCWYDNLPPGGNHPSNGNSLPWGSWSNCEKPELNTLKNDLESCLEKMAENGVILGLLRTLKKWHCLDTVLEKIMGVDKGVVASKRGLSRKVNTLGLWDKAIHVLSVRLSAGEKDGVLRGRQKGGDLSVEEGLFYKEGLVALRLAKEVIRVQQGFRANAVKHLNETGGFSRSLANSATDWPFLLLELLSGAAQADYFQTFGWTTQQAKVHMVPDYFSQSEWDLIVEVLGPMHDIFLRYTPLNRAVITRRKLMSDKESTFEDIIDAYLAYLQVTVVNPAMDRALPLLQKFALDAQKGKIPKDKLRFGAPWSREIFDDPSVNAMIEVLFI
ncbi:hypothetical protein Tco_1212682 [Tanacetum coccineum]